VDETARRLRGDAGDVLAIALGDVGDEVLGERKDVADPCA
jgi:hypothetical protein